MTVTTTIVVCDNNNCGRFFTKRTAYLKRATKDPRYHGKHYCSRKCYGQILGNLHGFKVHPENIVYGHRGCQYEYLIPQISTLASQGYSLLSIACMLNIPSPRGQIYHLAFKQMLVNHNITFHWQRKGNHYKKHAIVSRHVIADKPNEK